MSARATLRTATREAHNRVDQAFARFDLTRRDDYANFLRRHASAMLPLEDALGRAGAERLVEGWAGHRRSPLLLADLAELGTPPPTRFVPPPPLTSDSMILGALYVLEGSRLGGAVLRRQVVPGLPLSFLGAVQDPGRWSRFVASLDALLYSSQCLGAAVDAALATFACFERAATETDEQD